MKAAIKIDEQIFAELQDKLNSYDSSRGNSVESDMWEFSFDSCVMRVDFSFFDDLQSRNCDYLLANNISVKDFAKLLLLEVFSKRSSYSTFKDGVDALFLFTHFIVSNGCKIVLQDVLEEFLEFYLMHSLSSGKIVERLSPRNYYSVSASINKFVQIDMIVGYYGLSRLFGERITEKKVQSLLKSSLEVVSAGELTFGDWKRGGTFNHMTLDYGRYYTDYCMRFFQENYEVALGIAAVISNMEKHIVGAGLTLHKNTKQVFYGLLEGDDVIGSKKYKKFKEDKLEKLKNSIEGEYREVVDKALRRKHLLSEAGIRNTAAVLGIRLNNDREDNKEQYLTEVERLRQIVFLYLEGEEDLARRLLAESKEPSSFDKFVHAIKNENTQIKLKPSLPNKQFYQCIGRRDERNSQPLPLTFLSKVRSAGITVVVSLCGWRGSEFGFPATAISKTINDDILDQYSVPIRYTVEWHVFKTNGYAVTTREITSTAFELIKEISRLNQPKEAEPALYPSHSHAANPTSKSASHSAIKYAVARNWENYVFHNQDFIIIEQAKELDDLREMVDQGHVVSVEQMKRLQLLNEKSKTVEFQRVIQDPNLIEAKRKAEEQYERVMFVTNNARGFYMKGWLVQYQNYLLKSSFSLPDKIVKVLDTSLSRETKLDIQNASKEACANKTFISQVTSEVMEDCLYPTPHAFRHMWAEAVYRRFDGDAGWFIRSNFKHVSKGMWLAYIRDKDNRRMHDTIKVRVASAIMKNWLANDGKNSAGKFHKFLRKLVDNTTISNLENIDSIIEKLAKEDIISIKANPWGFCIARLSTVRMTKCYDGFDFNPQNASPNLCMDCINNLTMSSNIDYIVLNSWQHIDLLLSEHLSDIPASLVRQSLDYVKLALKRITELEPAHSIISKLESAISRGSKHGLL